MRRSSALVKSRFQSARHRTEFLAAGPVDGPLVILMHGWPDLAIGWTDQLKLLGAMGFRAVAPDMRGYGGSATPAEPEAYALREIVADMIELLDHLGRKDAVWIGHDWGAPVVWSLASHFPNRCRAAAALSVPYRTLERGLGGVLKLVDRRLYPEAEYPAGQWEYLLYYAECFDAATAAFESSVPSTVKALFRRGDPTRAGTPAYTASVRRLGGWFGGRGQAPELPLDTAVLSADELEIYVEALSRNGFAGPNSWYMNHNRNAAYATEGAGDGRLRMPVLFMAGAYDYTCDCIRSRLAEPMLDHCGDVVTAVIPAGHWLMREAPCAVNTALVKWLMTRVADVMPAAPELLPIAPSRA